MISINEQQESFSSVNQEIHRMSASFISKLKDNGVKFISLSTSDIQNEGIWPDRLYYLKEGNISLEYDEKDLFIFDKGDLMTFPSIDNVEETGLYYSVKSEVEVESIMIQDLYQAIANDVNLISQWFSISSMYQIQLNQMIGVLTQKEERANPGFGRYKAGMAIINEGEDADYVYSVSEGTAVAVYNGVEVGEIHQDEIFGAIAVLTNQKRTASVIAKTNCTVLMVHKDEFSKMVNSHPKLFLNILTSLAEKITALNDKVSSAI